MRKKKYVQQDVYDFGEQVFPNDKFIENIVLGTIMLEMYVIDRCVNELSEDLFYDEANKKICKAILEIYAESKPIDIITVSERLRAKTELDSVGGYYHITYLSSLVASSENLDFHIKILQEKALKRKLILSCSKGVQLGFSNNEDVFVSYTEVQNNLDDAIKNVLNYEIESVGEVHSKNIKESYDVLSKGFNSGVRTGLRAIDNITNGWQDSDLIILAGRPSMGKTAAAVSMAIYPAIQDKTSIAIFSLEMSKEQLTGRIESWVSGLDVSKIIKKQLTESEIKTLESSCEILKDTPIYIDDTPNISLIELRAKSRRLVKEKNVKLIIVDYLQLMRSGMSIGNREQEIAEISRGLKGIAKELKVPLIALSQLSRSVESRNDKKPLLSDLRESGQIEQDADMVIFCYRPEYYGIENYEVGDESFETQGLFMFLIEKHRNGELGEVPLNFIHNNTKLTNYERYKPINYNNNVTQTYSNIPEEDLF
jgi:replicative DNA helicase